jgi:transposase-like protein
MMTGSKEDAETVTAFFEDMKRRGLNDPLLVTSDGAPGIIKAIEICFPRAARQRCSHRMRNLEACIAHLRFLVTHRRAIRTTNLLERWSGGASRSFPMPSVNARSRK